MAAADTVLRFKDYIAKYIRDHNCYGESLGQPGVEFVPRDALKDFWNRDKIINVLCLDEQNRISADIEIILDKYLVVFSILVSLPTPLPSAINLFTELTLDDHHLPLTTRPTDYAEHPESEYIFDSFLKHQWKFCPLNFDSGRPYKAHLDAFHILPITNKQLVDPNADEEDDDVLVYKADWHPSCQGPLPSSTFILKEYRDRDIDVRRMLESEIDVYVNLSDAAFEHIVRYYGSFVQMGKFTIVLEYVEGGNLEDYLEHTHPPHKLEDREAFWRSFFRLLQGLDATHNLNFTPEQGRNQWLLKGIHQDIRPHNILLIRESSSSSPYNLRLKLTDFGTAHVRQCRRQGLDALGTQRKGNGMYSAPESYRDDNIPRPQLCECDIWSYGGVASEAFIWSIRGEPGRCSYRNARIKATGETHLRGGYHEGSFHDASGRLDVVEDMHADILSSIPPSDTITPTVSFLILEYMLVANPAQRSNAIGTYEAWEEAINTMTQLDGNQALPPRAIYGQTRRYLQRQGTGSTVSVPAGPGVYNDYHHQQFFVHKEPSAEPAAISPPSRSSVTFGDVSGSSRSTAPAKHARNPLQTQSWAGNSLESIQTGTRPPGPSPHRRTESTRSSQSRLSSVNHYEIGQRGSSTIVEDGETLDQTPSSIYGKTSPPSRYPAQVPGSRWSSDTQPSTPTRGPSNRFPERGPDRRWNTDAQSSPPNPEPTSRYSANNPSQGWHPDLQSSIPTSQPSTQYSGRSLGQWHPNHQYSTPTPDHRAPPNPYPRKRESVDTHFDIPQGQGSDSQHNVGLSGPRDREPWPATADLSPREVMLTAQHNTGNPNRATITIDQIFTQCIRPVEKVSMFKRFTQGGSTSDPLQKFPMLAKALNKLKGWEGRDQVFIVDDSVSMGKYKDQVGKTVRVLARILKSGRVDPNKQIDLFYTCTIDKVSSDKATNLHDHIEKHEFSDDLCDMYSSLEGISNELLKSRKPVSIYILTDGRWNAKGAKDLCKVDLAIRRILVELSKRNSKGNHVGIQFIRFFKGNDPFDDLGRQRLVYLDDNLKAQFRELRLAKSDIVDATDWDGDVVKMLLGGVFEDDD